MDGVSSARWNQPDIDNRAARPCVPLVDVVAVPINQQRAIKMRAFFYWSSSGVLNLAAPENDAAFIIGGLQFHPAIEGINGTGGEEVTHFAGSHHQIDSNVVPATDGWIDPVQRRTHRQCHFTASLRSCRLSFFADSERSGQGARRQRCSSGFRCSGRDSKDVYGHNTFEEILA